MKTKQQHQRNTRKRAAAIFAAFIAGMIGTLAGPSTGQAAGLLVAEGGFGGELEIVSQDVEVTVNNGIAVTDVTQVFHNLENRQVEALYTFPVPAGASVSNFSMWINGKEMVGEVMEKQKAREIYESYKRQKRDPGLLEQKDYKTFELRVFPIAPGAEQKMRLTYYQELNVDHDWATYVYPLAIEANGKKVDTNLGDFSLSMEVLSEVPIQKMESPSHGADFMIVQHDPSYYQASIELKNGDLAKDVVLAYHTVRPQSGFDLISFKEPGEDGYFCLTFTAGEELAGLATGMDYVFLLDISGSMANDGKLRISRESIESFIRTLGPEDRFEIVTFNIQPQTLFDRLADANEQSKREAGEFLDSQQARGGTILNQAIDTAYRYRDADRMLNVVVLSDGMTEQRERRELLRLVNDRPSGVRLFAVGVGNEIDRPLMRQIADATGGLSSFISRGDNFDRQAEAFRRKLTRPVVTGLAIDFVGAGAYDIEPQTLPNLYHGKPIRIYGRYQRPGKVNIFLRGDVGSVELKESLDMIFPDEDDTNPEIERMWAWHKVQSLLGERNRGELKTATKKEIVRLGEAYSIATELTSFIVLENDAEYRRWKIDRDNALKIERDRKQQKKLRKKLDRMRRDSLASLGPLPKDSPEVNKQDARGREVAQAPAARRRSRNQSVNIRPIGPIRDGGGALDPITGAILLGLASLGAGAARSRKQRGTGDE